MTKKPFLSRSLSIASIGLVAGVVGPTLVSETARKDFAKAAPSLIEFRWDSSKNYRKLYYFQSSSLKKDRSTYYFAIRPKDRKAAILKLTITVPDYFKAKITPRKLKLCKMQLGGMLEKTKCIEDIPAVFEVDAKQTSIDVFPERPIPADNTSFAVVMKIFNPGESGMYQFNALAQAPGDVPMAGYMGSWNIDID